MDLKGQCPVKLNQRQVDGSVLLTVRNNADSWTNKIHETSTKY